MKITVQLIEKLFCVLAALCLLSCSSTKKALDPAPGAAHVQKEIVYLHDTIFAEGSTRTIVEHDTIAGKPREITTIFTKTKTVKVAGQTKIERDTVFLRSEGMKANKRAVVKPAKKSRSYGKLLIIFLCAAFFMSVVFLLCWRRWDNIKRILSVVYKNINLIPRWRNNKNL